MKRARGIKESEKKLKALYYSKGRRDSFGFGQRGFSGAKRIAIILSLPFFFMIVVYIVYKLFFIPDPFIEGLEEFNSLPLKKTIHLKGKGIKSISVFIHQKDRKIELLRDMPDQFEKTFTLQVQPKDLALTDGPARVTVQAKSGILKEVKREIPSVIDTVPPTLEIVNAPYSLSQGTGGFAVLKSGGADSVLIQIGEDRFKAFRMTSEKDTSSPPPASETPLRDKGSDLYFAFFAVPFETKEGNGFYAVARDAAGNQSVEALPTKFKIRKYKTSSIPVSESFIRTVVLPLINETDTADPAQAFQKVNEGLREENQKVLVEISRETLPEMLWEGPFLQSRNTKVMATYGEKRTYYFEGRPASRSSHLGYDLASVKKAKVEASNSGVVIFADDLGIYGTTVIIDHGLGLMSLYGHLSTKMVQRGQVVEKGDVIGRTGSTGLAGGDHLHFGILIHGHEVSPLHWWDPKWVRVNVLDHVTQ